jgi:hypothetical protein
VLLVVESVIGNVVLLVVESMISEVEVLVEGSVISAVVVLVDVVGKNVHVVVDVATGGK